MHNEYTGVTARFLRDNERFILSNEHEMPLVIEALNDTSAEFLQQFVMTNAAHLVEDMAKYGAVLLRGFDINADDQFEKTVLSLPDFHGISEAFMSENGRTHVGACEFVLHTNSVYKTGGTLYLGGFHTENYYSADVPSYIAFCCLEPSSLGGETGIINTEKIYGDLSKELQEKLEQNPFYVCEWLVSEVAERYNISTEQVVHLCNHFNLPLVGEGEEQLIVMHKPSVFVHPLTKEKSLQLNLFELPTLNYELRQCFMKDYQGKKWFWHRLLWKLPTVAFDAIEGIAVPVIALFNSPKNSYHILRNKLATWMANRKNKVANTPKVGSCFTEGQVKELAHSMRDYYSSFLWSKGDILLIDNKKVMHAGMPGMGKRVIRTMIGTPLDVHYSLTGSGCVGAEERRENALGDYLISKTMPG